MQHFNFSHLYAASQIEPRANPGHLKELVKCPAQRAIFVGKMPRPRSYYDGQMSGPLIHTKILVAIFNKHNCFVSIELYRIGHEMRHSD